jgi:hypothetical protein
VRLGLQGRKAALAVAHSDNLAWLDDDRLLAADGGRILLIHADHSQPVREVFPGW